MQRNSQDQAAGYIQTCIDRGPERDSICNSTSVAGISARNQNAYCCERDFCNGKRQVFTESPPTTGKSHRRSFMSLTDII